jgi:HlyD family secretion protein
VTFHVDAYPTETFEGTVSQIRLQPVVVSNVTTYATVIDVPNAQLKLKPGMTANVKVEIAKRTDALRVPNAALRFRPTPELFAALNQQIPPEAQSAGGRGGRGGQGQQGRSAPAASAPMASATTPSTTPGAVAPAVPAQPDVTFRGGRGGRSGGQGDQGGRGGSGDQGDRTQRMMERFKGMSTDEQAQFIARMKDRGQDTSAFEKTANGAGAKSSSAPAAQPRTKSGGPASAQTIDALFAPLQTVESRGRAWLFMNHELKPVNLRLGISDGTNTELISPELQQNMEVVTSVTGLGATRTLPGQGAPGNPLMPGGRGPGGGFGGPGGGRGR